MPKRLFIAGLITESCTFSPFPTTLADFHRAEEGKLLGALMAEIKDTFLEEAKARGWDVTSGIFSAAVPSGPMTDATFAALKAELLADLDKAMPVDAVVLALHGAMIAYGQDDCEGDTLEAVRARVGPGVPVGVEIDPHANLSAAMMRHADLIVSFREWPHIDILDRARDVVRLTVACADGAVRPTMATWDCRMIDLYHTLEEPMLGLNDRLRALEASGEALSASIVHGYPFCDVADMGTRTLIVTDNDAPRAAALAQQIGEALVQIRGRTRPKHLSLEEGMAVIAAANHAPVVVADIADAPGGGAPGDAAYLLQASIELGLEGVALAYLHDPGAVSLAFAAGKGARLPMRIGGKCGATSGAPLDLDVEVVDVFPSAVVRERDVGDVALIRSGGLEVLLSRERPVAMHADHFRRFGIDPEARRTLIVKSVNNFRVGFEAIAAEFVYVAGPGALDTSLKSYTFRKIARPKWPLDADPFATA